MSKELSLFGKEQSSSLRMIDNPGMGNCAFYAYAIGLIRIVQEEKAQRRRTTFSRWARLAPEIRDCYQDILKYDLQKTNTRLLNVLQASLRKILYQHRINELEQACVVATEENFYNTVTAQGVFARFVALYYGYEEAIDSNHNEFAKNKIILSGIAAVSSQVENNNEQMVLAPLFISLFKAENSPIKESMQRIMQNYFWGTLDDLNDLSVAFQVNFHPYLGERPFQPFEDIAARNTLSVSNRGNSHWVTVIEPCSKVIPPISEELKLKHLHFAVSNATIAYCDHSKGNWFSLFHYHGASGRARARKFDNSFFAVTEHTAAQEKLIDFLSNKKNGNTHPHSYRTMLLHELLDEPDKGSLKEISRDFNKKLEQLKSQWQINSPKRISEIATVSL